MQCKRVGNVLSAKVCKFMQPCQSRISTCITYRCLHTAHEASPAADSAIYGYSGGSMLRTGVELPRTWPSSYDLKYPPLDQIERDMQHINSMVNSGKLPNSDLLVVIELWAVYQRGPYAPLAPRVFNNVIYAYSKLNAHMLAIHLYMAFSMVNWRSMANEAIKRSALQMAHPDAYVEALKRQESTGRPATRQDLEGLAVVCIRAREYSRALAVLTQLEQMPGELSPRVYKEMVISAMAVGDCDRAARAVLRLAEALFAQERDLASCATEAITSGRGKDRKSVLDRKWPDWLAKCVRMPEKVLSLCMKHDDAESSLTALRAMHLLGIRMHRDLAERVLQFSVDNGNPLLAEIACVDFSMAEPAPSAPMLQALTRAYANGEDVQGCFRTLQVLQHVEGLPMDDATWDAVTHSIVCLNNRVFLAGRQLRTKADPAAAERGVTEHAVPAAEDSVAADYSDPSDASEATAAATSADDGGAAASQVAVARSLLGFGFSVVDETEHAGSALAGSALDLLLPERRSNRWTLYNQTASMGLGIPEVCLSFAANAAEDVHALDYNYLDALHAYHLTNVTQRQKSLSTSHMASAEPSKDATFSDMLSKEREEKYGTLMRGRNIEEVLQSSLSQCELLQNGAPAPPRISNAVLNVILGALPRCRAGAFVSPTFQQLSKAQIISSAMDEAGVQPNGRFYGYLTCLMARIGKTDRALKVLEQAIEKGLHPPKESFRSLIRCATILREGEGDDGVTAEVLRLARSCGVSLGKDFEMGYVPRRTKGAAAAAAVS